MSCLMACFYTLLFAGMLLGLLVKYLWFGREECGKNVGIECTCRGINGTPHVITLNATSHQQTENSSQRCSLVSAFHMVNIANSLVLQRKSAVTGDVRYGQTPLQIVTQVKLDNRLTFEKDANSTLENKLKRTRCLPKICTNKISNGSFIIGFPGHLYGLIATRKARQRWHRQKDGKRAI